MKYLELIAAVSVVVLVIPPAVSLAVRASTSLNSSIMLTKEIALVEFEAGHFLAACTEGSYKTLLPNTDIHIIKRTSEYTILLCTLLINGNELGLLRVCKCQ